MLVFHLRVVGLLLLGLAIAHLGFPRRSNWKADLAKLELLNRQIFWVHCFFLCLTLTLMGTLCFFWPEALLQGGQLSQLVSPGLSIFWFLRLLVQFWVYDQSLWRGKSFETAVHILFGFLWSYFTLVFVWAFVSLS